MYRFAILGAGNIAHKLAETVKKSGLMELYAVASRDKARSEAFAAQYHIPRAYGSYEEMLSDPHVDLVYVATPHIYHAKHVTMCLNAGKHVLCEKAFTITAAEAEAICSLAREKKLLLAEAIWTRYMPLGRTLRDYIDAGHIGRVHTLSANLGYPIYHKERIFKRELGGGALLDVGIYALTFASMMLGDDIADITSSAVMSDTGVDQSNQILISYQSGARAMLYSTAMGPTDRQGILYGEEGYIIVENINNFQSFTHYSENHEVVKTVSCPPQITGYEYEVAACRDALHQGLLECPDAPHEMSIRMMAQMDRIRSQWGLTYPAV